MAKQTDTASDRALITLGATFDKLTKELSRFETTDEDLDQVPEAVALEDSVERIAQQITELSATSAVGVSTKARVVLHYNPQLLAIAHRSIGDIALASLVRDVEHAAG